MSRGVGGRNKNSYQYVDAWPDETDNNQKSDIIDRNFFLTTEKQENCACVCVCVLVRDCIFLCLCVFGKMVKYCEKKKRDASRVAVAA